MKRHTRLLIATLCMFVAQETDAQNATPRLQIYGGYSILRPRLPSRVAGGDATVKALGEFSLGNVLGWNTGATFRISRRIGIASDLSGYYRSLDTQIDGVGVRGEMSAHTFLFGPTYTWNRDRVRPFARVLAGFGHLHAEGVIDTDRTAGTSTAFAGALGGGVDIVVNRKLMVRPLQFDYFPVRDSHGGGLTFHNIRFGAGLVLTFDSR